MFHLFVITITTLSVPLGKRIITWGGVKLRVKIIANNRKLKLFLNTETTNENSKYTLIV